MSDQTPITSYTQKLVGGFVKEGLRRLEALSENDLNSVVYWLETKQMELSQQLVIEDDALQAAKYRGGIEHLGYASMEVAEVLRRRLAAKDAEEAKGDE